MIKKGAKLICIFDYTKDNADLLRMTGVVLKTPVKNEIVTFDFSDQKTGAIFFDEYIEQYPIFEPTRIGFNIIHYAPIISNSATSELTSSFVEVSEKSDLISVPEKELTHS